ncbi:hypothetical protein CJ178_03535 [Rhodococcus sp. ACPA4]|uniref:hypothetical protein n=1 Tax=Rhodococcus sp. ACPA4 TaxID=2028571 RepID=UPI000BB0DCEF|nr:hypothetical protein [Rhodococcus sp. ACPA4]PBC40800.1 hypothetical protein CJ178_03535 [Rhodococcus sp. ACPA4]
MFRGTVGVENGRAIVVMDSMSQIETADRDCIVVAASNGGQESGRMAIATGCALAVMNDAGVGKDHAGISGIIHMGEAGLAGVAVSHDSAEISNGMDMWHNGTISYVNGPAASAGIRVGDDVRTSVVGFALRFPLDSTTGTERPS